LLGEACDLFTLNAYHRKVLIFNYAPTLDDIAWKLANDLGVPSVEIGPELGISTSAVSKILQRRSR
jgi:hypothetical protein